MAEAPTEKLVAELANAYAERLRVVAARAETEEQIRIESERQLAAIAEKAGVALEGKHEFTVASGRIDSVYERVVIEYKNPASPADRIGPSPDSPGTRKLIGQIQSRFSDLEAELGHPLNSILGVGIDGNMCLFVRYRAGQWDIDSPAELNRQTARRFLWALFNLGTSGKPYSPSHLAEDFGPKAALAITGVSALYRADHTASPKSQVFFDHWRILFGEVCGFGGRPTPKLQKLATIYGIQAKGLNAPKLLFAIQTYYVLFMKLMAAQIMSASHKVPSVLKKLRTASTQQKLLRELEDLEAGGIFRHHNITNFLEGDLFSWYLCTWSDDLEQLVRTMVEQLDKYNPGSLSEDPAGSRDLLKNLYQVLFPRDVRHDLGEYYTPDWLAEHVLDAVSFTGDPDKKLLDPACGSGTFLVLAINRVREWYERRREERSFDEGELCRKVLDNITGFELNPLAVMASRANYLIAIRDWLDYVDKVEIPIYLCDAIMTPSQHGGLFAGSTDAAKELATSAGKFLIPTEVAKQRTTITAYAGELESCIRNKYSSDEFLERCDEEKLPVTDRELHAELYEQLRRLDAAGKNGIWARIIKNSFAPLFLPRQDFIVGNPPWINWESLPHDYRDSTKPLWSRYGLFTLKGHEARLGGGKKDLSMLFVYACIDNYLADGGILGFVITQTVFKTRQAGEGFRRFAFESNGAIKYIRPISVIDMTAMRPFHGATNRTATFLCKSASSPIAYPLEYESWHVNDGGRIAEDAHISSVLESKRVRKMVAVPMIEGSPTSAWMTTPRETLSAMRKVAGDTQLQARAGVCTWLNGVYWLRSVEASKGNNVVVSNWHDVGEKKVREVRASIEAALVHPLLRGRDLHRWRSAPSTNILLTQDPESRRGITEGVMKRRFPKTYEYLMGFESELRARSGFKQYFDAEKDPFWSIYNVGPYSISPHRIAYKEFSDFFQCAVLAQEAKAIVCDTKLRFIECSSDEEAHLLCGLLNSPPAVLFLYSTASWVQTADYQASDIGRMSLPRFDMTNAIHVRIADVSRKCHEAIARGESDLLEPLERELSSLAASHWRLSSEDESAVEKALEERGFHEWLRRDWSALSDDEEETLEG